MARDNRIYGMDDNDFAESCAADALVPKGPADYWGSTIDQDAFAKGNDPKNEDYDAKIVTAVGTQKAAKSKGN